jgi:hypothetical protein
MTLEALSISASLFMPIAAVVQPIGAMNARHLQQYQSKADSNARTPPTELRDYSASRILAMMVDGSIFLTRINVTSRASSFDNRKASLSDRP